jgi:hypothetical protein
MLLHLLPICFGAGAEAAAVVPLPGVCGLDLGHKIRVCVQDVKDFDNLPALPLLFTSYVQKNFTLCQLIQRGVNGFPVGARPGVMQQAAIAFNGGISYPVRMQDSRIDIAVRKPFMDQRGRTRRKLRFRLSCV